VPVVRFPTGGRTLADIRGDLPSQAGAWLDRQFADAATVAVNDSATPAHRAQAVELLGQGSFSQARTILPGLLDPHQPPDVQAAALRALASFDDPDVASLLLSHWKTYAPARRTDVIGYLLGRRAWIGPLLDAVQAGTVPAGQIPPTRRTALLADRDPTIQARAKALLGGETPGPRTEAVARYKPAIERPGSSERGTKIYERECLVCHQVGTRGHSVGPNLSGMRNKTAEEIMVNILDPNREVSPEFIEYAIALDDGRVVTGVVASETPSSVTLRNREGAEQTILRRNVAEITNTGKSLMPEGMEKNVTPQEMTDLITYLLDLQK
jgi:putative heme-binding domain-containing protein